MVSLSLLSVLILILTGTPATAGSGMFVAGRVDRVVDGGTLVVDGRTVRLWGIAAPDSEQVCQAGAGDPYECGRLAAAILESMILQTHLGPLASCEIVDVGPDRRIVGRCRSGGADLAARMVAIGFAKEDRAVSDGAYTAEEAAARLAGKGLWATGGAPPAPEREEGR